MKIDPTDSHRQVMSKPTDIIGTQEQPSEFKTILQKTVKAEETNGTGPASTPRTIQAVAFVGQPERTDHAVRQTGDILDTLDTYRQLLADPNTNLRRIQPVVERLERETAGAQTIMLKLPQGHAVRQVMNDTLIQVSQEIERFRQGVYV